MHLQPLFNNERQEVNGVSEELFAKGLCLPSGTKLNREDITRICTYIKEVLI
jgi:dTDP-4-amino-4,6-dideoxygalactose transaminase